MGKITVTGFAHTMGTGGEYNQSLNKIASSGDIHIWYTCISEDDQFCFDFDC